MFAQKRKFKDIKTQIINPNIKKQLILLPKILIAVVLLIVVVYRVSASMIFGIK